MINRGFIYKDSPNLFQGEPHQTSQCVKSEDARAFWDTMSADPEVALTEHLFPIYDIKTKIKLPTHVTATTDTEKPITEQFYSYLTEQAHNFKITDDVYYTRTRFILPHVDWYLSNNGTPYIARKETSPLLDKSSTASLVQLYKRPRTLQEVGDRFFIKEYLDGYSRTRPWNLYKEKSVTPIQMGHTLETKPIPVHGHYSSTLRRLLFTNEEINNILPNKYLQTGQYEWLRELTRWNYRVAPRRRGKSYAALGAIALREIFKDPLNIRELGKPVSVRYFSINYEAIETVIDNLMESMENLQEYQMLRYVKTDKAIYFEEQRPGQRPKLLGQIIFHTDNQDSPGLGYEGSLIIIDEATEIKPILFDNIKAIVKNIGGRCICVSTLSNPTKDKGKKIYKRFQQHLINAESKVRKQPTVLEALKQVIEQVPIPDPEDPEYRTQLRKARTLLMDLREFSAIRVTMRDDELTDPNDLVDIINSYKDDMETYKIYVWNVFPQEGVLFPINQVVVQDHMLPHLNSTSLSQVINYKYPFVLVFADPASRQDNAGLVYKTRDTVAQKIITLETHILSGDYHVQASQIIDHIRLAKKYSDTVYAGIDYGGVGTVLSSRIEQMGQALQYKMATYGGAFSKERDYDENNNFYKVRKNHMVTLAKNIMQQGKIVIPASLTQLIDEYNKYANLGDEDRPDYGASSGYDDLVSADLYSTFIIWEIMQLKYNNVPKRTREPQTLEERSLANDTPPEAPSTYDRYAKFQF